jgi:uncharacterized membrane protein YfcA
MEIMQVFGYAGAFITGLVLGLMGGGGALLSIPVLVYLFHIPASVATGYSLFIVGLTASSGAVQNMRNKKVDYVAALFYGIPSVITVFLMRRYVVPNLPEIILSTSSFNLDKNHFILLILSVVMYGAAYKMITDKGNEEENTLPHKNHRIFLMLYAIVIGAFLGLVGAGGGFLMVPALIYFANVPTKHAISTSLLLVALNSWIGFLGDVSSSSNMNWKFLFTFSAFSIVGLFTGTYLSRFVDARHMKKYFGWFILLVGIYIVIKETFLK